jgi:hypothetical protein
MPIRPNATARGILVSLLILAFLSVPIACAAMLAAPVASAHPCCPKSPDPDSDRCPKMGCLSAMPLLPPESATSPMEFQADAPTDYDSCAANPLPEIVAVSSIRPPGFELFLHHHQFLI